MECLCELCVKGVCVMCLCSVIAECKCVIVGVGWMMGG